MKDKIIVKRYAEAYLGYCRETIGFQQGLRDLLEFKNVLRKSPEFKDFLDSAEIVKAEKSDVIDRVLEGRFSKELGHFLKLLLDKRRFSKLLDIIEYSRLAYAHGEEL